jgi:phosphate transport system substrate-binding protein
LGAYVPDIRFSGAGAIGARLMPELINAFASFQDYSVEKIEQGDQASVFVLAELGSGQTAARFILNITSSAKGFVDLFGDESDLAMSMREASEQEIRLGGEAGYGDISIPELSRVIALDALIPIVSPRNTVQQVSLADLARVFAGEVSNWRELGGIDAPIVLHLPDPNAGILRVFLARIMAPAGLELAADVVRHQSDATLVQAVATDPFAIGLATLSELKEARPLTLTGSCGFRADFAAQALKSDDYPLTAPMFLYRRAGRLPAIARDFLRFLNSPAAQLAILQAGFVDQTVSRTPMARQGVRLANAIQAAGDEIKLEDLQRLVLAMTGARRLSVTFRFDDGSSGMTAQSRSNVSLLARTLETGIIGTGELVFAGFSDAEGRADANQSLSRKRAAAVREAVVLAAATADPRRVKLRIDGFGEAMPMACDDTEWGRQVNRRVEVWAR